MHKVKECIPSLFVHQFQMPIGKLKTVALLRNHSLVPLKQLPEIHGAQETMTYFMAPYVNP